ncbi:unnamed protein product [Lepidochelys kempii]
MEWGNALPSVIHRASGRVRNRAQESCPFPPTSVCTQHGGHVTRATAACHVRGERGRDGACGWRDGCRVGLPRLGPALRCDIGTGVGVTRQFLQVGMALRALANGSEVTLAGSSSAGKGAFSSLVSHLVQADVSHAMASGCGCPAAGCGAAAAEATGPGFTVAGTPAAGQSSCL